ncbi:MAG: 6-bladed beta-propeller [Acidobacteriota bacterium]|nr:6-bladed beta-propeller [Acidobacteriota bacterium]
MMKKKLKKIFLTLIACFGLTLPLLPQKDKVLWEISQFGEQDFFHQVSDIAVDPSQSRIYLADSGNNRIVIFDFQGKFLGTIGKPGQGPGEFAKPTGIFVGQDSSLIVADFDNRRIQIFDPKGTLIRVINTRETKVANVVSADDKFFTIPSFGYSGYSLTMQSEEKSQPLVTVLDAEGNKIQEIRVSDFPESHPFIRAIKHRVCLALSPDKKLYLPYFAMNIIQVFDLEGKKVAQFKLPLRFEPITPRLEEQKSAEGIIQMRASLDMVSRDAQFGPDGRLYVLTHKESSHEALKKARKPQDIPLAGMQIEIIEPSTYKVIGNIPCESGAMVFSLLDKEHLVYIHENDQGEMILKCVKY